MVQGGARNRSGPPADPKSLRSAARKLVFTALPAEGFRGDVPAFPLPAPTIEFLAARELEIWVEAWSTPQAAAWAVEKWRLPVVAEYVRLKALCEVSPNAPLIGQLHRYRDQLGLTPAGLKENGWSVAADEVAEKRGEPEKRKTARDRMKVVPSGDVGG